jgi:hypothetical protein
MRIAITDALSVGYDPDRWFTATVVLAVGVRVQTVIATVGMWMRDGSAVMRP